MRKISVIELIKEFLFGKKYYINIINTIGTDKCEVSSFIFDSPDEVEIYKKELYSNNSFRWIETKSFRSRRKYKVKRYGKKGC